MTVETTAVQAATSATETPVGGNAAAPEASGTKPTEGTEPKVEAPAETKEEAPEEKKEADSLLSEEEKTEEKDDDPVPDEYEFKVPEGTELDSTMVESFKPLAKELGLGNTAAQKLVDLVATHTQRAVDAQREQEVKMISEWKSQITSDPNHKEVIASAKLTVQKFGNDNPEFKKLTDSWLGSHPGFVKFLAQIGNHLKEADMPQGTIGSGGEGSLGSILYPNMNKK